MSTADDADPVRLSVLVDAGVLAEIRTYAARKDISVTEAVRRAFSVLLAIDGYNEEHAVLYLEKGGKLHEVLFLA
jgi:hypothetical protein